VDESDVVAELFGGTREDFLATRTERAREARAAGDRDLAKRIGALRKPTVAAWLVNQLVRQHPDDAEALADVAERLGAAHRQGTGDELRAAGQDRRELLHDLDVHIRRLAKQAGVAVSADAATQIDTTFQAALVDPAALREVLAGQLSGAVEFDPSGIDQWSTQAVTRPKLKVVPPPPSSPPEEPSPSPEPDPEVSEAEERVSEAESARDKAERSLTKAQRAAERTEESLAEARAALDEAQERHYAARDAVGEAKKAVTSAVQEAKAAESALVKLQRKH
jgi:hypothetical protein